MRQQKVLPFATMSQSCVPRPRIVTALVLDYHILCVLFK